MQQKRTKNLLEKANDKLLGEIGCRLPNNQRLDFLKKYSSRLKDDIIYEIATEIPEENLLEFFRLKILKSEDYIALLATRLPEENILEFFKLGQLKSYSDDNRMKVARRLPQQDLIAFFQMKLIRGKKNIAELATNLPKTNILEFFKMKLLSDEEDIAKIANRLPPTDILEFFKMKLLSDEKKIAKLAKGLPDEEFLQFWNLELVSNLELLKPKIDMISDELLNGFIDETNDYKLKTMFADAIRNKNLRLERQNQLRIFAENKAFLNSFKQILAQGTSEDRNEMVSIFQAFLQDPNSIKKSGKTQSDE